MINCDCHINESSVVEGVVPTESELVSLCCLSMARLHVDCLDALLLRHRDAAASASSLLWAAVPRGNTAILQVLVRRCPALLQQLDMRRASSMREFVFNDQYTLVMLAAERRRPDTIEWLFDQCGVDLFAQLAFNEARLAASCACVGRAPDCLRVLLAYGSPVGDDRAAEFEFHTTLSWATVVNDATCCALLLAAGAVVDEIVLAHPRTDADTMAVLRGENSALVDEQRAKLAQTATRLWRRRIADICIGLQAQMISTLELELIVEFALPFAFRVPSPKRFAVIAQVRHFIASCRS
jgi:hypothetical protein